jgi:hypothetical protein
MKKNLIRYKANPVDYEATITRARKLGLKVETGGDLKLNQANPLMLK